MESLNDRLVAERDAHSFTARLGLAQGKLAQKLRRAAARIYEPESEMEPPAEISAFTALGTQANAVLNKAADYIEHVDAKAIRTDLTRQVQRNPGASLLIAAAAGCPVSARLRRR